MNHNGWEFALCACCALSCSVMLDSCDPTDWTCKASLCMGLYRQEYQSRLPFLSPGDLPNPGIESRSPALQTLYWLSYEGSPLMGMGKFNLNDHYINYCGKEFIRRNVSAFIVNRFQNAVLKCSLRNDRMVLVHSQGKPFNITVIQVYALSTDAKEAKVDGSMKTYITIWN